MSPLDARTRRVPRPELLRPLLAAGRLQRLVLLTAFLKDSTPSFFISHLHWLPAWKWAFHGFGAVLAFWCGRDPFGSLFHRPGERPR